MCILNLKKSLQKLRRMCPNLKRMCLNLKRNISGNKLVFASTDNCGKRPRKKPGRIQKVLLIVCLTSSCASTWHERAAQTMHLEKVVTIVIGLFSPLITCVPKACTIFLTCAIFFIVSACLSHYHSQNPAP